MVGYLSKEVILASAERGTIHSFHLGDKGVIPAHHLNQVAYVVRYVPTINPTVVLCISSTRSLSSRITVIKRLDKLPVFIFRMKELCFRMKDLLVVEAPVHKITVFIFLTQSIGNLCQAPFVIHSSQSYRYRLTSFERMYFGHRFFFTGCQRREITLLHEKLIQFAFLFSRPGSQCLFSNCTLTRPIGFLQIKSTNSLCIAIRYYRNTMIGIHSTHITYYLRESRHPIILHLLRHTDIRIDHVALFFRFNDGTQRVCCPVSIPQPIVRIERNPLVIVYFPIESAVIPDIFGHTNHPLIETVERSIENSFIFFRTALYFNLSQGFIPYLTSFFRHSIQIR